MNNSQIIHGLLEPCVWYRLWNGDGGDLYTFGVGPKNVTSKYVANGLSKVHLNETGKEWVFASTVSKIIITLFVIQSIFPIVI